MIYGIGVDLVKISRIREALDRWGERFYDRVYTEAEQTLCLSRTHPLRFWAMRFAAKEAFSKAIGFGMRQGIRWRDIEVVHNVYGRPGTSAPRTGVGGLLGGRGAKEFPVPHG